MGELDGKVAIVTGSSSGIGEAAARSLAEAGAHVVVNSSSSVEAGQAVADSLPTESLYLQADVSDEEQDRAESTGLFSERFDHSDRIVRRAAERPQVHHLLGQSLASRAQVTFVEVHQRVIHVNQLDPQAVFALGGIEPKRQCTAPLV